MDLRSLSCVVALAEERHFGRAAVRLAMTQSALSQRIAALEADIGHPLFVRRKGPVAPTAAGEAVVRRARLAIASAEAARADARLAATGRLGRLRIGFTQIMLYAFLPELVVRFRAANPGVEVVLNELNSPTQEQALADGRLDVGLVHPPLAFSQLDMKPVGEIEMVLAMPARWPQARARSLRLAQCSDLPFLFPPRDIGPVFHDRIIAACHAAGFSPRIVQEATPMSTLIGLAAAGIGTGFVAACMSVVRRPGVAYVRVREDLPRLPVSVAWRRDDESPAVRRFAATATELE